MSKNNKQIVEELESILQLIADVWPNDRENVALAVAKFEDIAESFDKDFSHLQQLSTLTRKGIKYLYERDQFFMTVKASTMHAVNLFREYYISEDSVKVEDFEKSLKELNEGLAGSHESADTVITEEELEHLKEAEHQHEECNKEKVDELQEIAKLLAEVVPEKRDNVALAGAKFEEIYESVVKGSKQIQKLANQTWEGLKYLFEKDEHFPQVKDATIQTLSIFSEYISKGDISVDAFEKSFEDIEKALSGEVELDEKNEKLTTQNSPNQKSSESSKKSKKLGEGILNSEASLDDLASFVMMMDEANVQEDQIEHLAALLLQISKNDAAAIKEPLLSAYNVVVEVYENTDAVENWFEIVSSKIEEATVAESNEEWEASQEPSSSTESEKETEIDEHVEVQASEPDILDSEEDQNTSDFLIPEDIDVSMVSEFITECSELIEAAEGALLELEDTPDDNELVNTVFRAFHTIKGTSAFMGLDPITEFTHCVETVLSIVRDGDLPFDRACADINFESIDIIKNLLDSVENLEAGDPLPIPGKYNNMMKVLVDVSDNNTKPADALAKVQLDNTEQNSAPAVAKQTEERVDSKVDQTIKEASKVKAPVDADVSKADQLLSTQKSDSESSVRVSVNRLDRLIDMVGELVIAHSVVAQDQNIPNDSELQKKVNHATKILRELQDTSLTLRMVPLKATFHKMNRLVRDLSRKAGKNVKFTTTGEDTEIDRNMVDIINEPLIHMLRNSLDHGIEDPELRAESGKSEVSNIALRAYQEGGKVVIQIEDDGKGIDKELILRKGIEKGLVDPEKKLTDAEIYGLIFLPGFSSAEKVTDLSGRGVGMDVVRRSIEQLQGKVEVSSELNVGTTINIELPFTLAITDGMLIRVGEERFIVPTINIDMTFRAQPEDLFTVLGASEQVSFRGRSVPVMRLNRLFEIDNAIEDIFEGTLLIIKNNKERFALLVDEVIGQQQLVGKSINMINTTSHISGGAILGDGRVGLILDTAALTQ